MEPLNNSIFVANLPWAPQITWNHWEPAGNGTSQAHAGRRTLSLYEYVYIYIYSNLYQLVHWTMFHCQRLSDSKLRTPWASNILCLPNSKPGMHPIFGSVHWLRTRLFQCTESWCAKSEIQKKTPEPLKKKQEWLTKPFNVFWAFHSFGFQVSHKQQVQN